MKTTLATMLLTATALTLGACDTTPKGKGETTERRMESRTADGRELGSADVVAATDAMVAAILNDPDVKMKADGPTVIVMDRIENKTGDRSEDFQIFLARIRANLNQAGAEHKLQFIETRTTAEGVKAREGIAAGPGNRIPPDFALTGSFYSLDRNRTSYYLLTFQLLEFKSDAILWEGSYEVKR